MARDESASPGFLTRCTRARNDHGLDTLMQHIADACTFMVPVGYTVEGTTRARSGNVRKGFTLQRDPYPDAHFEPVADDFNFIVRERGYPERVFTGARATDRNRGAARGRAVSPFCDGSIALQNPLREQAP